MNMVEEKGWITDEVGEELFAAAVTNVYDCAKIPAQAQTLQRAEQWEL